MARQPTRTCCSIVMAVVCLGAMHVTSARVLGLHIEDRVAIDYVYADERPYEKIVGEVVFGFDPDNRYNARIVDLKHAPVNPEGLVTARANFMLLRPMNAAQDRRIGLLEVSNRGGKAGLRYFNFAEAFSADPSEAAHFGDGLLMEQGLTLIWVGWQHDVPTEPNRMRLAVPVARAEDGSSLRGWVRSDWTMTSRATELPIAHRGHVAYAIEPDSPLGEPRLTWRSGRDAPRASWALGPQWQVAADGLSITADGGFMGGGIHELVYPAANPRVVGLGLAAVRDFMAYLKNDRSSPARLRHGIAVGISQTGRFLRHFLYQGFNRDERGRRVFDGMLIHSAGAGRGSFNHRFAQPSRDGHRYSAFNYPTDLFPFSGPTQADPHRDQEDGLLVRYGPRHQPRIMYTNTGYEYWGRAASLIHTTPDGSRDIVLSANERAYHLASGQHYVHRDFPTLIPNVGAVQGNWLNFGVNLRALLVRLVDWVADDRPPPPSALPSIAAGELVPIADYAWRPIRGVKRPNEPHLAHVLDFGPRWDEGIIDRQPPEVGAAYGVLVPQLDAQGNERGGVRNVEVRVPVASWLPWSLRHGEPDYYEMADFVGTVVPLPREETDADWRPALSTLYPDQVSYETAVDAALEALRNEGFLLERDVARVREQAMTNWFWVQSL